MYRLSCTIFHRRLHLAATQGKSPSTSHLRSGCPLDAHRSRRFFTTISPPAPQPQDLTSSRAYGSHKRIIDLELPTIPLTTSSTEAQSSCASFILGLMRVLWRFKKYQKAAGIPNGSARESHKSCAARESLRVVLFARNVLHGWQRSVVDCDS